MKDKDYQSTSDIVATVQLDKATIQPSKSVDLNQFLQFDNCSSLATSTLSISYGSFEHWPEFQQKYHSIMDNTNLLDSCAAALSDITADDDRSSSSSSAKQRQTILPDSVTAFSSPASSNTNLCGGDFGKVPSPKDIEVFTRWLCEMELRMERQPTLSQIFAMDADEMAVQMKLHSKIFNDIVARPCIVKGSKRKDHKSIEERYHLLYLKAYEVLLLLEGLPNNSIGHRTNSNKILNKSFYDFDDYDVVPEEDEKDDSESIYASSSSAHNVTEGDSEQANGEESLHNSAIYTQTNVKATNLGTYYFKYEQIEPKLMSQNDASVSANNSFSDKELTFSTLNDFDLRSLLNYTDAESTFINQPEYMSAADEKTVQQQMCKKTMTSFASQDQYPWTNFDFAEFVYEPSRFNNSACHSDAHHKVCNWLYSKAGQDNVRRRSSLGLERSSDDKCETLYRTKSETNLHVPFSMEENKWSTLRRASINCLPLSRAPLKPFDIKETSSEISLDWDNFQTTYDTIPCDENDSCDFELHYMRKVASKLCDFGSDYSLYLDALDVLDPDDDRVESDHAYDAAISESQSEPQSECTSLSNLEVEISNKIIAEPPNPTQMSQATQTNAKPVRRIKRATHRQRRWTKWQMQRKRMAALAQNSSSTTSTLSLTESMQNLHHPDHDLKSMTPQETIAPTHIDCAKDENTVKFNKFDSILSKMQKISDLKPEDFYDIITACHNNIDCVITVLTADTSQTLSHEYCEKMKNERNGDKGSCHCSSVNRTAPSDDGNTNSVAAIKSNTCQCLLANRPCICSSIAQTVTMIINFVIDCWNIFRNMKLYTYFCGVLKGLLGLTHHVAVHLRKQRAMANVKVLKYY